jgi:hypothetical protein
VRLLCFSAIQGTARTSTAMGMGSAVGRWIDNQSDTVIGVWRYGKKIVALGLAVLIVSALSNTNDFGFLLFSGLFVVLPLWGFFAVESDGFKTAMICYMVIWAIAVYAPDTGSSGGGGCYTDWDGRSNPLICD